MAYGDFGGFLPHESNYSRPGAALQSAKSAALGRASYLSEMDKFYAQLEQAQTQFEANYELEERALELEAKSLEYQNQWQTAGLDIERSRLALETEESQFIRAQYASQAALQTQQAALIAQQVRQNQMLNRSLYFATYYPGSNQNAALSVLRGQSGQMTSAARGATGTGLSDRADIGSRVSFRGSVMGYGY